MYNLGVVGLSPGNGHPYSWSAIFNGFDRTEMDKCPFEVIPEYLNKQDPDTMCIPDGRVTHIWTQERTVSEKVAQAALIDNIVDNLEDMIGQVDAVLLARDDGENHLKMARPFIEADVPILIDKPLTDNHPDLKEFVKYYEAGKPIMSCSSQRYAQSIQDLKEYDDCGEILNAVAVTPKLWRTYAIHKVEGVYAIMRGGIESVQNVGSEGREIVVIKYPDGRSAVVETFKDIKQGGTIFFGEKEAVPVSDPDAFFQFKSMLEHFIGMLDSGEAPFDWRETVEMAKVIIGGHISLKEGGRAVKLEEIKV